MILYLIGGLTGFIIGASINLLKLQRKVALMEKQQNILADGLHILLVREVMEQQPVETTYTYLN